MADDGRRSDDVCCADGHSAAGGGQSGGDPSGAEASDSERTDGGEASGEAAESTPGGTDSPTGMSPSEPECRLASAADSIARSRPMTSMRQSWPPTQANINAGTPRPSGSSPQHSARPRVAGQRGRRPELPYVSYTGQPVRPVSPPGGRQPRTPWAWTLDGYVADVLRRLNGVSWLTYVTLGGTMLQYPCEHTFDNRE